MIFSNKWTAPNGREVITFTINFQDGNRSVAAVYSPKEYVSSAQGWRPIATNNLQAGGTVSTRYPGSAAETASHLDARLAAGDVLYYIDDPSSPGAEPGFWAQTAQNASASATQAFTWGMSQLAGNVGQGSSESGMSPPAPGGQGLPLAPPVQPGPGGPVVVVPAVSAPRWPWYLAGAAVIGTGAYLLLD